MKSSNREMEGPFASFLSELHDQPGLDPTKDPRLEDGFLGPEDLDLVGEEMLCEFELDPCAIAYECFLTARLLWLHGRIPRDRVVAETRRLNAITDRHARAIAMFAAYLGRDEQDDPQERR
jgi:hypothetical protein